MRGEVIADSAVSMSNHTNTPNKDTILFMVRRVSKHIIFPNKTTRTNTHYIEYKSKVIPENQSGMVL